MFKISDGECLLPYVKTKNYNTCFFSNKTLPKPYVIFVITNSQYTICICVCHRLIEPLSLIFSFLFPYSSIAEVIEEPVKPTLIQQELECLNEEIIKNLLDEQDEILLKSPSSSTNSTTSLGLPTASTASSQRSLNDTPTYDGSSDGEAFTGTFYNGSMM